MEKKLILPIIFLLLLNIVYSDCTPNNPCCCQTEPGGQKRCWASGICCKKGTDEEYWSSTTCYNFVMWTSVSQSFRVGQKTPVALYLQNTGGYVDTYDIDYEIIGSPSLILVDMNEISPVSDVSSNEKRVVYPRITVLATSVNGVINFTGTSRGDNAVQRSAILRILESDYGFSLPEFGLLFLIQLLFFATLVYFYSKK